MRTAEDVERIGQDMREMIGGLRGQMSCSFHAEHSPAVWEEIQKVLALYRELAASVGIDPALLPTEEGDDDARR